jgi:dipeptidyl aminopeptidase/acylaminoacyl peptidase
MKDIKKNTRTNNYLTHKHFAIGLAGFLFWLVTCPSWGQVNQKQQLTKADYHLWSKLVARKLSNNGNWASYLQWYESKIDTLFVKSTKNNVTYNFPNTKDGDFNKESHFACIARDTLLLQNLETGKLTRTASVTDFSFSANGKYLLMLIKQPNQSKSLIVQDRNGKIIEEIAYVRQWRHEPNRNGVIFCIDSLGKNTIGILELGSKIIKNNISSGGKDVFFQNLKWSGNSIVYVQRTSGTTKLFCYRTDTKKLNQFEPKSQKNFPPDLKISDEIYNTLVVSDDGDRIFFWLKENPDNHHIIDPLAVQVWNTGDKLVFDHKKNITQYIQMDKLALWSLKSNEFIQITNKENPKAFLSGDYTHAFIYDPIAYEPQNSFDGAFDLYTVNLITGKRKCILKKYSGDYLTFPSPCGKFLAYPKEGNWWIYDINKDTHTNITSSIPTSFFRQDQDKPVQPDTHGLGGWNKNDNSIILYDQYDLWQISVDGSNKNRLTHGREIQRTYRINNLSPQPLYQRNQIEIKKSPLHLSKGFILEAIDKYTGASGFYKWSLKNGETPLVWRDKKVNQLIKAEKSENYIYVEQSYEAPPRLMLHATSPHEITQTNPQHHRFHWGRVEPIRYTLNGKELSGVLYFPAEYQNSMKYPMVVRLYERQFQYFNNYEPPSSSSGDGFNIPNFTTKGYFVFLPDMVFETGNVGQSATACVLAAVDAVIAKGFVDPKKIGLIGHSFGGYETDLIITQTDRFTAAVSGAAWTNLISGYLYVGTTFSRPDFYRAEYDQLRIGKSLFEDMGSYLKNSPVLQAANVKTPLLGWVGEKDRHIHYLQSMEFYMALRRLNKPHTLLVYPDEGHSLWKRENQNDLSLRIEQWFDYYLKNDKPQNWMTSDFY